MRYLFLLMAVVFLDSTGYLYAQQDRRPVTPEKCATMPILAATFAHNPLLKAKYTKQLETFNRQMQLRKFSRQQDALKVAGTTDVTYTVPIVFHIVLTKPAIVTDAQIMQQLKILNEDFAGTDPDSTGIPSFFRPLHGKGNIQFCLAQRTPMGDITNGIERTVTTTTSFIAEKNGVKHTSSGGVDLWDESKYYNVWVCELSNDILGYATFPTDGETTEQGVAIHYKSLPGGTYYASYANYDGGKTLTHETGHYFNLYHIWGDDSNSPNGNCSGSDFVEDTPNQADATIGCYTGVHTDACTTSGNGILYEDYMDYSNDQCLLVFTPEQMDRMQTALLTYRTTLLAANGCTPVVLHQFDAQARVIAAPPARICSNSFSPAITIKNKGSQLLASVIISTVVDNGTPVNYTWNGTLVSQDTATVSLASVTVSEGVHTVQIYTSFPDGATDQDKTNDTLTTTVQYYAPGQSVSESFEGTVFPPPGWDIVNPDNAITWQKVSTAATTSTNSVMINNFNYTANGQQDYLRLPTINLSGKDSAFFTFTVAAATFTDTSITNNSWDTLEVLISTDCGLSYASLYKKWGATLVTHAKANTSFFIPSASEWRKDSVNLTPYINSGNILLAFRNTTENENNIYLDDVNVRTITINPNLRAAGFLVTPNPATSKIQVQFYPNPTGLRGIGLYNLMGQKLAQIDTPSSGLASTLYTFDINPYPAGMYVVRVVFDDRVVVKKVIKN